MNYRVLGHTGLKVSELLKAAELQLTAAELDVLSATTAPRPIYPQWMIELQNEGRR